MECVTRWIFLRTKKLNQYFCMCAGSFKIFVIFSFQLFLLASSVKLLTISRNPSSNPLQKLWSGDFYHENAYRNLLWSCKVCVLLFLHPKFIFLCYQSFKKFENQQRMDINLTPYKVPLTSNLEPLTHPPFAHELSQKFYHDLTAFYNSQNTDLDWHKPLRRERSTVKSPLLGFFILTST